MSKSLIIYLLKITNIEVHIIFRFIDLLPFFTFLIAFEFCLLWYFDLLSSAITSVW